MNLNLIMLIVGIVLLVWDVILAAKGRKTISQRAQKLCRPGMDWIIGIGGGAFICYVQDRWYPEFDFRLAVFISLFWGHIWISNKERCEKRGASTFQIILAVVIITGVVSYLLGWI